MIIRNLEFKRWELALVGMSTLLFGASTILYIGDVPLRKYVLGWQEETGTDQVGQLGSIEGNVRRQVSSGTEFQSIQTNTPLYNYDTLVTSQSGSATILLEDGGTIQLGPNTMVRLAFEESLSLGGVARSAAIEVVAGKVSGESKKQKIVLKTADKEITIQKDKPKEAMEVVIPPPVQPQPKPKASTAPVTSTVETTTTTVESTPSPSPSPSPSPIAVKASPTPAPPPQAQAMIQLLSPRNGVSVQIDRGSPRAEKAITFEWKSIAVKGKVLPAHLKMSLWKLNRDGRREANELFSQIVPVTGKVTTVVLNPGPYEWEVEGEKAHFIVLPEFQGISMLDPLIGGQSTESNVYTGQHLKDFSVTLQWKPFPDAKEYQISMATALKGGKIVFEKSVDKSEVQLPKDYVFTGTMYFVVRSTLPSGFMVTSGYQPFHFNFLPPVPITPADNAVFSKKALEEDSNTLLLTWQKTNFTHAYQIEIAQDAQFKKPVLSKKIKENFFVLRSPPIGNYWWRVQSFGEKIESHPSRANRLSIKP